MFTKWLSCAALENESKSCSTSMCFPGFIQPGQAFHLKKRVHRSAELWNRRLPFQQKKSQRRRISKRALDYLRESYGINTLGVYSTVSQLREADANSQSVTDNLDHAENEESTPEAEEGVETEKRTFTEVFGNRLPTWLLDRLQKMKYDYPTKVQQDAIEAMLPPPGERLGKDTIIQAQTGSGKTLSYLIPLLAEVDPERASIQGLIVVPTPELGLQVYKVARRLASAWKPSPGSGAAKWNASLSVLPMFDRGDLRKQKLQLREAAPRVIVSNPDRVVLLANSGRLRLDLLRVIIIDEFDACLLDTSTTKALQMILSSKLREPRQTVFVSATVPQHKFFLRQCIEQSWTTADIEHVWTEQKSRDVVPETLIHQYAVCELSKKLVALCGLLRRCNDNNLSGLPQAAVVFVAAYRPVDAIVEAVNKALAGSAERDCITSDIAVGVTDSNSVVEQRKRMDKFRRGDVRILISTDLAARGLDVSRITHIFNFDLPVDADKYLHRAGRAGRLGQTGTVISLISPGEEFVLDRFANELGIGFSRVKKDRKLARAT